MPEKAAAAAQDAVWAEKIKDEAAAKAAAREEMARDQARPLGQRRGLERPRHRLGRRCYVGDCKPRTEAR
jgi:hypothetical protein